MSYLSGAIPYATVGIGTRQVGNGTSTVTCTINTNVRVGDLVVMVLYAYVNPGDARDIGQGWVLIDSGWNDSAAFGLAMWAYIATETGGTSRSGIELATSGYWAGITYAYRPTAPFVWDLPNRVGSNNWWSATADARAQSWNPYQGPGAAAQPAQGISLCAAGCTNNAIVAPTGTALSGYTERADSGGTETNTFFNVYLMDRSTVALDVYSTLTGSSFWSNTSARIYRASVRGFVPVRASVTCPGRYLSGRRVSG